VQAKSKKRSASKILWGRHHDQVQEMLDQCQGMFEAWKIIMTSSKISPNYEWLRFDLRSSTRERPGWLDALMWAIATVAEALDAEGASTDGTD